MVKDKVERTFTVTLEEIEKFNEACKLHIESTRLKADVEKYDKGQRQEVHGLIVDDEEHQMVSLQIRRDGVLKSVTQVVKEMFHHTFPDVAITI